MLSGLSSLQKVGDSIQTNFHGFYATARSLWCRKNTRIIVRSQIARLAKEHREIICDQVLTAIYFLEMMAMKMLGVRSLIVFSSIALISMVGCKSATETAAKKIGSSSTESAAAKESLQQKELDSMPKVQPIAGPAAKEPDFITVQHILIGFKGSVPGKPITRSKAGAEGLAKKLLATAQSGEKDFGELVRENTDDAFPGIYAMANDSVAINSIPAGTFARRKMVPAFGNAGFPLQVGEVGMANHDLTTSPYGWHIVKRIK